MATAKEKKKGDLKRENVLHKWKIEDPLNSSSWRCVVVMAVERYFYDSFVVKEFMEESSNGRRQEVSVIDLDSFVMKILNEFANGELPYKYAFLLNFSPVFQEAVDYIIKKMDVPILVLVKVVKALLFYLREESLAKIEKMGAGVPDPIKAMTERPTNIGTVDVKKKEVAKKGDNTLKVRPPSVTKQETELLKRGEKAKDDQCINDAPQNAYFNLYVLLSGFYNPDFPLELIKAGVPLHALLCIDTSLSGLKRDALVARNKLQKQSSELRAQEIQNFWTDFPKMLWDPNASFYFRDTIFQVYMPQRLLCDKKKLREFIYREISYLMYDLSDLKRQLNNYLDHMQLWHLSQKELVIPEFTSTFESIPNECVTAPLVLQNIIDGICQKDRKFQPSSWSDSINTETEVLERHVKPISPSVQAKCGSSKIGLIQSQELKDRKEFNLLDVYYKVKELDIKYDLEDSYLCSAESKEASVSQESDSSQATCNFYPQPCGKNMEEALQSSEGVFNSYWRKHKKAEKKTFEMDYCLYSFLMTKVLCSYQARLEGNPSKSIVSLNNNNNNNNNSDFELIENLDEEMRKPHFTVTDGSRSILKAVSYNISRDFFCPEQLKIVSPEKLKASSAPEFRVTPSLKIQTLFTSQIFRGKIPETPFGNLKGFIDECLFSKTNDFDFLEFLSKPKLLEKEYEHWGNYDCIDHSYSFLNDCIFLMLHNRKNYENVHLETFNEMLRTAVGLRDFYEYVMEDEAEWIANQEELYQSGVILANKMLDSDSFRDFTEPDFWLQDSLKYRDFDRSKDSSKTFRNSQELQTESSSLDKTIKAHKMRTCVDIEKITAMLDSKFEGYDVNDMTIQLSGLKTVYYTENCSVAVQLIERLYGDQELGVHVTSDSNTLHLYSYVCPKPHVFDPFMFHLTCKNGIIMAFGQRFVEIFTEIEETVESRTAIKSKRNSSEVSTRTLKKVISKMIRDNEFFYDLGVSLPNGLYIQTIRNIVKPCYIKQGYLVQNEETARIETSRLFLPNGNVVKMMRDGTVQILMVDASIVNANLKDLINDPETGSLNFVKFEHISGEGYACIFEQGIMTSSKRFQIFQNTNVETNQLFFRRKDGTNYMLDDNGTICIQFSDGTKMSSSVIIEKDSSESSLDRDLESDFVVVYMRITSEHPDYATVLFDNKTLTWKILLPFESTITTHPDGNHSVNINEETELKVVADLIKMTKFSRRRQQQCTFKADLSVFRSKEQSTYCRLVDFDGKTFVVEANSNTYIVKDEHSRHSQMSESQDEYFDKVRPQNSEVSELVAVTDLQACPSDHLHNSNKLCRENKYFVIRRDLTGVELLHVDDAKRELTNTQKGSLVFTQTIPNTKNRCFVLISPKPKKKPKKWQVDSILPNPKYEPSSIRVKTTSSTYGVPPSWMHPFPKKKSKFVVPEPLTCRLFVETQKTVISPRIGNIEAYNCEIDEPPEVKHSVIPQDGVEDYLKRLSDDDQDILKEMYTLAAASLINGKKRLKQTNSEKLEHYLEMSRYYTEMREYHKKCIMHQIVPSYFHHPDGMSWLILNGLLNKLKLSRRKVQKNVASLMKVADTSLSSSESISEKFSLDEVEYNLSISAVQSFSDLSYRSNISAKTAPDCLETRGVCRCKVRATKEASSTPAVQCCWREPSLETDSEEAAFEESDLCSFRENDIQRIKVKGYEGKKLTPLSFEDLMFLGLV